MVAFGRRTVTVEGLSRLASDHVNAAGFCERAEGPVHGRKPDLSLALFDPGMEVLRAHEAGHRCKRVQHLGTLAGLANRWRCHEPTLQKMRIIVR